jgi:hypothetical protein
MRPDAGIAARSAWTPARLVPGTRDGHGVITPTRDGLGLGHSYRSQPLAPVHIIPQNL